MQENHATSSQGEQTELDVGLDEALRHVEDFGKYQRLMVALVSLINIPVAVHPFLMYFATLVPSWRCTSNSTLCIFNGTLSEDDTRRCSLPRSEWKYTEQKLFSVVTQFDLSCDHLWILSFITFMFFAGWAVGAIVHGRVSDKYGRKKPILPSLVMTLAAGAVSSFMPNIYLVVVCYFVIGFCRPGVKAQTSLLLSELVATKWRPSAGFVSTLTVPISWMVLGLKAYLLKNWRILSLVCSLPYILILPICFILPESVRWLQINGRPEKAREVLEKIAKFNKKELPSTVVVSTIRPKSLGSSMTMKSLFGSKNTALQTFALITIWCFTLLCYYGLIMNSSALDGDIYKNFALLSLMEFPGILLAIIGCQRIGRKRSTLVTLAFGGVACLVIPWISKNGYRSVVRLVLGIFGRLGVGIAQTAMIVWTMELYPTNTRSTALGVMHTTARAGAASSPWIVNGLKPLGEWIPFTVMGVSALIGSLAGLGLQETKDKELQEVQDDKKKDVASVSVA